MCVWVCLCLGHTMDKYVYNTLIVGYSRAGKYLEALSWYHKMEEAGCQANQVGVCQ